MSNQQYAIITSDGKGNLTFGAIDETTLNGGLANGTINGAQVQTDLPGNWNTAAASVPAGVYILNANLIRVHQVQTGSQYVA